MKKLGLSFHQIVLCVGLLVWTFLAWRTLDFPLTGTHKIRQADTLFTGYSYCIGDSTFWLPKIAHRENTEGVAIGEFPLFSEIISWPCQLTGVWTEVAPKLISYALWFLNFFIWGLWFRRRYASHNYRVDGFLLFFIFSPLLLTYLTIPIPDGLAVALVGIAALFWLKSSIVYRGLSAFLFTIAFTMRPYLFPLLIVFAPDWRTGLATFFFCGLSYLLWFKFWIRHTQIWYYLTDTKSLRSLLEAGWRAPSTLIQQILLSHINYIGLIPFVLALKLNRRLLLAWVASILFILILKSDHFVNHPYYFMATGLISVIAMTEGYFQLSETKQKVFTVLFTIMGLLAIQHNWRPPADLRYKSLPELVEANHVQFSERIAVYDTFNPQTLYLAKRVGWYFEKEEWKGPLNCPSEATWALLFDSSDKPSLISCQKPRAN